jgi:DNA-binding transcriptional MerR regulator
MKKEKNLFSIGEIAKALGVTRRIILNYEQRGLIQPDINYRQPLLYHRQLHEAAQHPHLSKSGAFSG